MKANRSKPVFGGIIALIALYAAAVLVNLGVRYGAGAVMSNLIGVICIGMAFCAVTLMISGLSANARKRRKKTEEPEESDEVSERERINGRAVHIVIFTVCLCIAAVLAAWAVTGFGGFGLAKLGSGEYRMTQATVLPIAADGGMTALGYEYTVNGTVRHSLSSAEFGGIVMEAGRQVNIFYLTENPRVTASIAEPVLLLLGALLFAVGGIGMMIAGRSERRGNITGILVLTFFAVFGIGFYVAGAIASGLNFFELALSGTAYYGVTVFMLAGIALDVAAAVSYIGNKIKSKKAER